MEFQARGSDACRLQRITTKTEDWYFDKQVVEESTLLCRAGAGELFLRFLLPILTTYEFDSFPFLPVLPPIIHLGPHYLNRINKQWKNADERGGKQKKRKGPCRVRIQKLQVYNGPPPPPPPPLSQCPMENCAVRAQKRSCSWEENSRTDGRHRRRFQLQRVSQKH